MKEIIYLKGDATTPRTDGHKMITHICNDMGGWGKGFVVAISKRWKAPEQQYREWYKAQNEFQLGRVQFVSVEDDIEIANMIAQHGFKTTSKAIPIRYSELELCLQIVAQRATAQRATIHMPRIGCGLAGGTWEQVEEIIKRTLCQHELDVYVYDL